MSISRGVLRSPEEYSFINPFSSPSENLSTFSVEKRSNVGIMTSQDSQYYRRLVLKDTGPYRDDDLLSRSEDLHWKR